MGTPRATTNLWVALVCTISLSRIPLGVMVAYCDSKHMWQLGAIILCVGILSDILDGEFARLLHAETKFGEEVLEPVCDLALTLGAMVGLILTGSISTPLVVGIVLYGIFAQCVIWLVSEQHVIKRWCNSTNPLFYIIVITGLLSVHLVKAWGSFTLFPVFVGVAGLTWWKQARLKKWLCSEHGLFPRVPASNL